MLFYASFNIVGHADPKPPPPPSGMTSFMDNPQLYIYILELGGEMAKSTKVLALLLQVGLLQVRILVAARRGKNVWNIGKPPAPNSVPYVPQHIDGRPAM